MRITGNALLLRPPYIRAPSDGVIPWVFLSSCSPIGNGFSSLSAGSCLVDAQGISKSKLPFTINVESGHSAGFGCAQVQTRQSGIERRRGAHPVRLDANAISESAESEIRNQRGAEGVSRT